MDENRLLNFAVSVGEVMLRNGAETSRVEDTVDRILFVNKNHNPQVFVTPTGIFASIDSPRYGTLAKIRRIDELQINLEKITLANNLSREFVSNKITLDEGMEKLEDISNLADFPDKLVIFTYGVICLSFAAIYNGGIVTSTAAFVDGILLGMLTLFLRKRNTPPFLNSLIRGCFVSFIAIIFHKMFDSVNYAIVTTSTIMPLVPGVATTNAIRDIMNGDFLSGASRTLEAVVIAISVAAGVGFMFALFKLNGGA